MAAVGGMLRLGVAAVSRGAFAAQMGSRNQAVVASTGLLFVGAAATAAAVEGE